MTERELYANRSLRAKLRFTGPERAWFLHQILTQAFEDFQPGEARDAAMITAHGRMVGYLETVATDEAVYAHFEAEQRDSLEEAIRRYVFATRVEIEDVTDDYGLVLVVGSDWESASRGSAPDTVTHRTLALGVPAGYLWVAPDHVDDLIATLKGEGYEQASEDELEALRVERGMARWGRDMNEKTLPPEVGLDEVAIHYDKGCYVGQEAMAKIKHRGKVNRLLRRLFADSPLPAGAEVTQEGRKVGSITSSAGERALAVISYTVEPGSLVRVGEIEARVVG